MQLNNKLAGILIFIGVAQFLLLMMIAEFLYPGYSVANNYISDLGVGPSAYIFNSSIIILGILGMIASIIFYKLDKIFSILLFLSSLGAFGVGVFPENMGVLHTISAFITFFFGGVATIYSYRVDKSILKFLWILLGIIVLGSLSLYVSKIYLGLGVGGMERMIVYPLLIWLFGIGASFASYLKAEEKN